jgi:hypothetical protein
MNCSPQIPILEPIGIDTKFKLIDMEMRDLETLILERMETIQSNCSYGEYGSYHSDEEKQELLQVALTDDSELTELEYNYYNLYCFRNRIQRQWNWKPIKFWESTISPSYSFKRCARDEAPRRSKRCRKQRDFYYGF